MTYAEVVGFGTGTRGLHELQNNQVPFNALARTYAGSWLDALISIGTITSFVSLNIVTVVAGARMLFAMGRDGMLPRGLAAVNRRSTPARAAIAVGTWGLATSLLFGLVWNPLDLAAWASFLATLFFIGAYLLLNAGALRRRLGPAKARTSVWAGLVVPAIGIAGVGLVLYGNVHPTPPSPLRWFIWATAGLIAMSAAAAMWLERRDPDAVKRAGRLFGQADETA